jgi:hypothetical protein
MATFKGAQTVNGGYYLNTGEWKLEMVEAPSGTLPGDAHAIYRRVPVPAMLALAPIIGLVFVMAVPFIGLAVIGEQLWKKLRSVGSEANTVTLPPR